MTSYDQIRTWLVPPIMVPILLGLLLICATVSPW
jgi:hypothetical protein